MRRDLELRVEVLEEEHQAQPKTTEDLADEELLRLCIDSYYNGVEFHPTPDQELKLREDKQWAINEGYLLPGDDHAEGS